jgi:formate C-acetyltransferase
MEDMIMVMNQTDTCFGAKEQPDSEPLNFQFTVKPKRSPRIQGLLDHLADMKPGICIERARYFTESYKQSEAYPQIIRRAKAFAHTLDNMTLYIMPGSLLVGGHACKPNYSPLAPDFSTNFIRKEIISGDPYFLPDRPADKFQVDPAIIPELQKIADYWDGKNHQAHVYAHLSKEVLIAQDKIGAINDLNYVQGGDGHFAPPYGWHFRHGLRYVINQAEAGLEKIDKTSSEGMDQQAFYKAVIIACEAVIRWAHRYAELEKRAAAEETDSKRKAELLRMAEIAQKVPEYPADTYYEALQLITFLQLAVQVEDNAQATCPGRFDQVMNDIFLQDMEQGLITRDSALELLENFFIMLSQVERVRSWEDTAFFRGKPIFQNLTIGGVDPLTGKDATNEMTYLILDSIQNTRTVQPSHYARWHKDAPMEYKKKVVETIRLGTGFPAVSNDSKYIEAMMNRGYSKEDALDYCIIGCAEPGPPGLRGGRTGAAWYSLAKCMEMSLYNGKDVATGITLHENCNGKELSTFENFDELWDAFIDQAKYYIKLIISLDNAIDKEYEEYIDEPFSAILACPETTLSRGKSIKKGGAKYDFTGNQTIGLAVVANSLYAIRKLIFEQKTITGAQLQHALETNFQDMDTEPTGAMIQQMCLSVPKYGNDIDEVDLIAKDALEMVCNEFPRYKNTRNGRGPIGGVFQASTTTVSSNTPFGQYVGATPDGRSAKTPLSDGQSPFRGTDTLGPTAAVSSVSKLNLKLLSEGSLYNLKLSPSDLKD